MATTTNYAWDTPDDTDLVKDGAAAIRTLGSSIDTTTKALNPSTTLGDIEYRSATANTNTRLGIGTSGQVLTVAAGVPSWATSSAGGMTVIASGTLSGSSVDLTSISGSYNNLLLYLRNARPNSDGSSIRIRLNGVTAADGYAAQPLNSAAVADTAFGSSSLQVVPSTDSTTQNGFSSVELMDYANTATWKFLKISALASGSTTPTNYSNLKQDGYFNSTNAITSILIYPSSGTFDGGTYILYGVK